MSRFFRILAKQMLKIRFVRKAVRENADLQIFRQKLTPRIIAGLICIAASYIFCWPVIGVIGIASAYWHQPLWVVAGTPVVWGLCHFLCMFGVYLAGSRHSKALLKWVVRVFVEKHAPECLPD